jgi:hypothetical protein
VGISILCSYDDLHHNVSGTPVTSVTLFGIALRLINSYIYAQY